MANRNTQGFPSPEEDPRFHDTYQFLRRYRDATYSLKVVVHQMEHQFKLQYDNDIDKFLDSIYAAGADLTGSDIEQRAKSIARSNQMLKLLESSIDLLRNNHKHGEQYYWILYYAFLSPQEMKNTDEILDKLAHHITNISYRTYYRKRRAAIEALSTILWGFTAKETLDGYPVYFMISEGQRNDINYAIPLLDHIRIDGSKVLADRGYDSNQLMDYIYDHGGEPTIPSRRGAKFDRCCDWWLYKERHLVENYFLKLKAFRRIATRYDKLAFTYLGFLCIVSILIWLK